MPGLPYDQLAAAPSVKDAPVEVAPKKEPGMGDDDDPGHEALPPELRAIATDMGFSPKQAAALKEFIHACIMGSDADQDDMGAEPLPGGDY